MKPKPVFHPDAVSPSLSPLSALARLGHRDSGHGWRPSPQQFSEGGESASPGRKGWGTPQEHLALVIPSLPLHLGLQLFLFISVCLELSYSPPRLCLFHSSVTVSIVMPIHVFHLRYCSFFTPRNLIWVFFLKVSFMFLPWCFIWAE